MFGPETLRAMNAEAAEIAREEGLEPLLVSTSEEARGIPNLGDACEDVDADHERVATLFCDTSGFGAPNEPALTQQQLFEKIDELIDEHGPVLMAIEEAGQFQAYVAVWSAS